MCRLPLTLSMLLIFMALGQRQPQEPPIAKGLEVHEWGVFRVQKDIAYANADMRVIWDNLPKFVYGQLPGRELPKHWNNYMIIDKPVIFFHSPEPVDIQLQVDFPKGMAAVWWPGTQRPAVHGGVIHSSLSSSTLEWKLRVKQPPKGNPRIPGEMPVDPGSWVKTLRAVQAEDIFSYVGEENFGYEKEKFVYYDGLLPKGNWVSISVTGDNITVVNQARNPVYDLTIIDRRPLERIRVARLDKLEPRAEKKDLEFTQMETKNWPATGIDTFVGQLKKAGLNEDEGASLVELWKQELFQTEGVTLFYRLPQEEYDQWLPIKIFPRPEKLVRVGLVQHPHCEPDLAERIQGIVKDLNDDNFVTREKAQKRLESMGSAAFVHLNRILNQSLPPETKRRIERLLQQYDAARALGR
ncbi:MAG TPA: hypothetical protein VGY77_00910 [Gemmataceae bacterium]|nr:hypothetical protein [Gemmataceae bacterium]